MTCTQPSCYVAMHFSSRLKLEPAGTDTTSGCVANFYSIGNQTINASDITWNTVCNDCNGILDDFGGCVGSLLTVNWLIVHFSSDFDHFTNFPVPLCDGDKIIISLTPPYSTSPDENLFSPAPILCNNNISMLKFSYYDRKTGTIKINQKRIAQIIGKQNATIR